MKKKLSWVLALSLALTPLAPASIMAAEAPAQAAKTVAKAEASAKSLKEIASQKASLLTEQYGTTSVQYALIDGGKIAVSGQSGINDKEGRIPLSKTTMYGIGSTSKVFTTAAVMQLVEAGSISLDTPIVQYIPEFKMKDERYSKITPRMLLNHSSGLQGSSLGNGFLFDDNDSYAHDTLLRQLSSQKLKADPGAYSVYSNDSFTLAEILVEKVSGQNFTAFIHEHFTGPLDLKNTKTSQDSLDAKQMAALYFPTSPDQLPNETVNVIGTGGIYSTAEDLVKFSTIFTGQTSGVLSKDSVEAMAQEEYKRGIWPDQADNSFDFGLGWDSVRLFPFSEYGIQALTKGGDTILYHASLVVLPEHNMAAAVLSSGGSSSTNQLLANEMLLAALKEKGEIKDILPEKSFGKPVKADLPAEQMDHAGFYASSNQMVKASIQENGQLAITVPMVPEYPAEQYVYSKDGSFMSEDGSIKVSFVKESNGRTYIWVRQYVSLPGMGQLALSHYTGEKMDSHKITGQTEAAWKQREGRKYFPLNEKYSSLMYFLMEPSVAIKRDPSMKGYLIDKTITGPDSAESLHQVPAIGSRDTAAYHFYKERGTEYLEAAGSLFVSEQNIKALYAGKKSTVTVGADGYARWFTVPKSAAGKTMTVTIPETAAFAVYDAQGASLNYSLTSGSNQVKLPENGTIVFAGDAGSAFGITLRK
ncbi:serine hydrolase domain-containing protein [Paenibacillus lemnae]|uniref:Beta-lactamase family protein n=1 Tax=Paenibacillus lemnae TaxID=1330551 RepID=A0A848M5Y1_PAELE|nr:serine hydrolase domain-containing protein [Paenibacillus lemnae]NMO96367.1 beta-lactamase family protein [Paenibacillus lemnae]